jgi:Family of unknown function (DUF6326)
MNSNIMVSEPKDRKAILSTLWIFVMFNYIYADIVMMIFNPAVYQKAAASMSEWLVLAFAALMEVAIAMVLLSRVLKYKANRWANVIAGVESTAFVTFTLLDGMQPLFYIFFAAIEIACTLFIVWYAWSWPNPEDKTHDIALQQGELEGECGASL